MYTEEILRDISSPGSLFTDPLFSLQSPSSARDKKINRGGFIDRQRKGIGVGEEENIFLSRAPRSLSRRRES